MLKKQTPDPTSQANLASAHVTLGAVYAGRAADRHTPPPARARRGVAQADSALR